MDASSAYQDSLPLSSDALLSQLKRHGIDYDYYEHIPQRTVEDAKQVQGISIPSGPGRFETKNLYLRDRKKRNYLIVLEQDCALDLKAFGAEIGAPSLTFGSADRLMEFLGVRPGALSALAMVHGAKSGVRLMMDEALRDAEFVHLHPLVNDRTLAMTPAALLSVLGGWGADVSWIAP